MGTWAWQNRDWIRERLLADEEEPSTPTKEDA
jgi:hypothetical protein